MELVEIFPWDENFNTGILLIDEQHRCLANMLNKLSNHMAYRSDLSGLGTILAELADYAVYHFESEEKIWVRHFHGGFVPENADDERMLVDHIEGHNRFTLTVQKMQQSKNNKPLEMLAAEVLDFLTRWLVSHILETDRYMGKIVLGLEAGQPFPEAKLRAQEQMRGSTKVLVGIILSTYGNLASNTVQLIQEINRHKQTMRELQEADRAMKAAMQQVENLAFYCPLTQLPNRRLLLDRLTQAQKNNARDGVLGALLFLDLDKFKNLNDTLGHEMGDLLLQQVAHRLTQSVREGDTVARLGGDEFVVILERLNNAPAKAMRVAMGIAEKILNRLSEDYMLQSTRYHLTTSIGITLITAEANVDELLKQSDIAMYEAKKSGRNTVRLFDQAMQVALDDKMRLESDLYKAVQEGQFEMYYQVQVNEHGQPFGAEALLRWIHPERGIVHPCEFITVAEDTGLIIPIGQWVIQQACAQLAQWQRHKVTADLRLSINVSAKQFHHDNLVGMMHKTVMHYRIRPHLLTLELTESIMLDNIESIVSKIYALRALGICFALDDFGSGYSSLQYIKRLPLDQLKIDKTFVRDLTAPGNDWIITRTIIGMAKSMGFDVIAEGVETIEQKNILLVQGGTKFQGFLFGVPLPIAQFEEQLTLMYHTLREGNFNLVVPQGFQDSEVNI